MTEYKELSKDQKNDSSFMRKWAQYRLSIIYNVPPFVIPEDAINEYLKEETN